MMISPRFIPLMCLLFGLALVPTVIHTYSRNVIVDGRTTTAIPFALADYSGTAGTRNATWGKRRFGSDDWIERTYANASRDEVTLTVVRSYDPKSLYHHPELAIAYGTNFEALKTLRLSGHPHIPVHVLIPRRGVPVRAMYVLHYGGQFVEDPVMFQIRTAGELLFSGRKAMTLFFVVDRNANDAAIESLGASRLLFAAIDRFLAQPGDAAAGGR